MRMPISTRVTTTPFGTGWNAIAASSTKSKLGATGAVGDIVERIVCVVATAATAQVQIFDGTSGTGITILPNSPGSGIGTYCIELGMQSSGGGWLVTTGAGVSVIGIGTFT